MQGRLSLQELTLRKLEELFLEKLREILELCDLLRITAARNIQDALYVDFEVVYVVLSFALITNIQKRHHVIKG